MEELIYATYCTSFQGFAAPGGPSWHSIWSMQELSPLADILCPGMQVAMMRKLSLQVVAALLVISGGAQVALSATADDQEHAEASQANNPGKMPNFWDPATRLLMWIQQNEGLVS